MVKGKKHPTYIELVRRVFREAVVKGKTQEITKAEMLKIVVDVFEA